MVVDAEGRLRILDFGLAKPQPAAQDATQAETALALTTEGAVQGTIPYMSPEQVEGRAADRRSDVFSLGVILYEMSTGRRPFAGGHSGHVMMQILHEDPTLVRELRADLPEGLERIVGRCLEKDPAGRYQEAGELRDELLALKQGDLPGPPGRPAVSDARKPERTALAVALAAAALLGVLLLRPEGRSPPLPEAAAAARADARKMIVVLPFENLGPPEDEYFAAGMTEEVTSRLAAVSGLGVISRNSAVQYAGTAKSTAQIGEELGVDYLLEGTVRWARGGEGATRLRITERLERAAEQFRLAVELDAGFVAAWRALTHILAEIHGLGYDTSTESRDRARRALSRVLELAPEEPETYATRGYYHFQVERDYELALVDYKLLSALGVANAGLGRKEEAIRQARRGTDLVPLEREGYFGASHVEDLAWVYTLVEEPEAALGELELLLGRPSHLSWPLIEVDPRWAPLRGHPRYQKLKP